jgi:DNA-binding transcriptional MerR regulator
MNIQRVVELTGLSTHTLRYYEKIGIVLKIKRNASGYRDYSADDLAWIEFIKRLTATGMPLDQIRQFAELRLRGESTIAERVDLLTQHHERVQHEIDRLRMHQEKIREKIEICKNGGRISQ